MFAQTQRQAVRMMGLNPYARSFVASAKQEKNGQRYSGTIGTAYYMNQYTFPDGRVYQEQVQAECGEVGDRSIFIALRDENGAWVSESLWRDAEIFIANL